MDKDLSSDYSDLVYLSSACRFNNHKLNALADRLQKTNLACDVDISASVLVLLTDEPCPKLLLTKRSDKLSSHAGEMAFVGGRRDDGDGSTAQTALREAFEEVGLDSQAVSVIGYLPYQYSKKGLVVRPVVAVVPASVVLVASAVEVERICWESFEFFVPNPPIICYYGLTKQATASQATISQTTSKQSMTNQTTTSPAWQLAEDVVWGLTGRIIADLVELWQE